MITYLEKRHNSLPYRILRAFIAFSFILSLILPPGYAQLMPQTILNLPAPGTMVTPTTAFTPALINGITIHPENPLQFDFIVNTGDSKLVGQELTKEANKLIKYFLAALTVPEKELWVNLSPYEKDRIIPPGFGNTEMGRDLLAQDYILKQLTASLMYPEKELGKKFWDKIYKQAREKYGTTEIPMDTFNKVWIVPEDAVIYEQDNSAFVVKSRLRVMLEQDYLAASQGHKVTKSQDGDLVTGDVVTTGIIREVILPEIIREIILPAIEVEVNEGKSFANLRQIYNSAILAAWFKQNLKETLLGQVYVDKTKTKGVDVEDKTVNEKIYAQYLEAFKKGVYNYIKEDYDPSTKEVIPRKYFSGGTNLKVGDLVETYKKGLPLTREHQEVLGEYLANLKEYNLGQRRVNVNLVELSEEMSVAQAQEAIRQATGGEDASSPVAVVMKFLPEEIGRGIWGGNLFAWKFNSYLNRITRGIESDKLKIAKEMGDLIRILMGFEGRYHDFLEVLKTRDDKDRHFDADGLVEGNRTRILGLLSISDTTEQALRHISIAREIAKSVESQAAGERIFQVPISNTLGVLSQQVIVDVSLRVTHLVSLVEETMYHKRPGKNFQVLVKDLAWTGRSESYYGRPGGKEKRVYIFSPVIDIVWSQADQVIEEDVKDHSLQNNAGVKTDVLPPVLPIIPGEEIDRVVGMVKEYDALSETGERELRLFFAQKIKEISFKTFLEDKKDVPEDRARHIVVSAWLAAKYHLSAVGMRGLFVYFEDGTKRNFYELGMMRADSGNRLSMREAGEILAEGDLLLSNGFASASSPVGEKTIPEWKEIFLTHSSRFQRTFAVHMLGELLSGKKGQDVLSQDIVNTLIVRLKEEEDSGVRLGIVLALGKIGGEEAAAALRDVMVADERDFVRDAARNSFIGLSEAKDSGPETVQSDVAPPPAETNKTILVLDPRSDREGTIKDLTNEGYAAVGISTAGDVLEKIKEGSTKIPLVIVEINAFSGAEGEKDFGEFLKALRKESPLTKVIVYTHADHIIIKEFRKDFRDIRFLNKIGGSRQLLEGVNEIISTKAEGPPAALPIIGEGQEARDRDLADLAPAENAVARAARALRVGEKHLLTAETRDTDKDSDVLSNTLRRFTDVVSRYGRIEGEITFATKVVVGGIRLDDNYEPPFIVVYLPIKHALQDEFGIRIPREIEKNFTTVGDYVRFIGEQLQLANSLREAVRDSVQEIAPHVISEEKRIKASQEIRNHAFGGPLYSQVAGEVRLAENQFGKNVKKIFNDAYRTRTGGRLGRLKRFLNPITDEPEHIWIQYYLSDLGKTESGEIGEAAKIIYKVVSSSPVEVAVSLDGGARLQTSLNVNLLSKLWSPSDPRRKHYQFAQDYQIVKAQEGQLKLLGAPRWTKTRTPLSDVDGNGVDDTLGILDKIKELDALRKKEGEPLRTIRVLDWGAGEGVALIALKKWLNEAAIPNVELIGYSDIYYRSWHNASEGITFIFDVVENLIERLKGKKIDLIYSRFGMYHYTSEAFDREEVVRHFSDLREVLSSAGEIRSDFFYLRDYEIRASGFGIMAITGKLGTKMYPIKDNVEDVEFASDEIRDTNAAPGGIDLNPALLDLQIKRDGNGVPLPLPMQPIQDMHIDGFLPIIINITPVTNLPLLLGLVDTEQDADETRPAMRAREPEEVSYLN